MDGDRDDDRDGQVCSVCGQPVATVVHRHKTLGAWVPVWGPGPCHNPQCPACAEPGSAGEAVVPTDGTDASASAPDQSG
ncbi:hypothetical protein ACFWII_14455 [Streptomyces sp. NPDC127063]|uniref:hypothetical protein n=1 Tax=Streptomyces sp. NPDC127063 TaxID=3347123 RepID=UPI00365C4900